MSYFSSDLKPVYHNIIILVKHIQITVWPTYVGLIGFSVLGT